MAGFSSILVVVVGLVFVSAFKYPPNFDRCHVSDPKLDECLDKAIENAFKIIGSKGIKSLNLPSIEPTVVSKIVIGAGSSAVNLVQNYFDIKLYGLSKQKIQDSHLDLDKKVLTFTGKCDEFIQKAKYDINGKILVLPVSGKGDSIITLKDVTIKHTISFTEVTKNGKKYFEVADYDVKLFIKGAHYDFMNLFNGDKVLGDNVLTVVNDNWKEIFDDVRKGVEKSYSAVCKAISSGFFNEVPVDDIFLP